MEMSLLKGFLKKYLFDVLFYSYIFKLSFLTQNHTKAEMYIGTLLSIILVCIKGINLKENEFEEKLTTINKKVTNLTNSFNSLTLRVTEFKKFIDANSTRQTFDSMKNPFSLRKK
jgi:hypothetical protein